MLIMGIESSCDETAVAILKIDKKKQKSKLLANIVSSQIKKHAPFGGVVPNLAARLHLENFNYCLDKAFLKSKISPKELDLVAVTKGPGLIPALLIGVETAKTLAYTWKKPIIGINHLEAHIYANFLNSEKSKKFPTLALIISGGHTSLVLIKKEFEYKIIGETRDDAVGEAFDKVARLLKLAYPGGPIIEKRAKKYKGKLINLPRPMINSSDFDFSFSGLKTAVNYEIKKRKKITELFRNKMTASFQEAVSEVLLYKSLKAIEKYKVKNFLIAGGVSANKKIQKDFQKKIKKLFPHINFLIPDKKLSTDNAVMVSILGYYRYLKFGKDDLFKLKADANLRLGK